MNNQDEEKTKKLAHLRRQAEQVIQQLANNTAGGKDRESMKRLVYELQVHQVELEMQNEELLRSRLQIEKSRNDYANLYEYAPIHYFTLDKHGLIIKLNLMAAKLLGRSRETLYKKRWISIVTPGYTDTFHRFFKDVLESGLKQTCELDIRTASGEKKSVHLQGIATITGEGETEDLECLLTLTDVTELKQAEEARNYARQFKQIIEGMPGLYLFLSPEGKVLEVNNNYLQALHMPRESILGHTLPEIFTHHIYSLGVIQALQDSLREVKQSRSQHMLNAQRYDIRQPNGQAEERYWRIIHSPVYNQEGQLIYIIHHITDITKEFRTRYEIETNRQRFEMLALASNNIVWEWDINKGQWWWNHNLETLFGYNRAQVEPGMEAWTNRIHPEQKQKIVGEMMRTVLNGGKQWKNEYQFLRADGSYAYVLDQAYAIQDTEGRTNRMLGTMIDITEQKQAEQILRKSNERFIRLLETLPHMAWISEANGDVHYYNTPWYTYTGATYNELKGWGWQSYIHPEDVEPALQGWKSALQTGENLDVQSRWRRASDGQYRWHAGKILPVRNNKGEIIHWVGSLTDIHNQKLQEEALEKRVQERTAELQEANLQLKNEIANRIILEENLRENQLLIRQIVDSTPDIVHVYDLFTLQTLYLNHAITTLFGFTLEDIQAMGREVGAQLIHPDDLPRCRKGMAILARARTNETRQMEYRLKDAKGNWRWVWVRYAVFKRNDEGMPRQVIGIVHDITEKKKYEQRLKQSQIKLKKLNQELENRVERRTERLRVTFEQLTQEFTGRIKMQEALQLKHQRFQVALERSPVILFTQDADLTYTWIHNAFNDLQAEDFIGKKEADLFPAKAAEILTNIKTRVIQSGKGHREEVCLAIGGKVYYYDLTVEPLFSDGKQLTGIAGAVVDITDTRLARAELARSEQRYRLLTESIPEMIFTTDVQGQLDFANHWMTDFTGLPAEALKGYGWWQAIHPDDLANVQHMLTQGSEGNKAPLTEVRCKRASDGVYIWHLKRLVPVENKEGQLTKWIGICTDIHNQKLVEAALRDNAELREAERKLRIERDFSRSLVDNSIDGIITFDASPCYTSWNKVVEAMYGIPRNEVVGKKIFDLFPEYANTEEGQAIMRVLKGEKITLYSQPYDSREGFYEINLIPLEDENKQVIGGLGIIHDVTERLRLEEERTSLQLRRQKDLLNAILEAQEAERRRIAEALHNGLGQVLYAAKLNLEHVSLDTAASLEARESKQKASQLLAEAIKETRGISHELIPTILEDFGLEGAVNDMCKKYTQADFRVRTEIYGFDEGERLEKYLEIALYRISQELVNNSVKHAKASKVHIDLVKGELGILLKVSDNGKGFDVIKMMHSKKGIGLKTIQDRVKLLNGSMDIQSEEGRGTAVTIKIPYS